MVILREFAYYDRRKIEDFISVIEGGLSREKRETERKVGAKIKGGIKIVEGEKGYKETERQELRVITDASLFDKLYNDMEEKKLVNQVENFNSKSKYDINEFLEIKGIVSLSEFEKIIIENFIPMMKIFPMPKNLKDEDFKMLNFWSSREITNIKIKPSKNIFNNHIFAASLSKANITVSSIIELEGQFSILCRVKKILGKKEKFKFFDIIPGGYNLTSEQMKQLIERMKEPPKAFPMKVFYTSPKINDFELSYPAIIVTPIAIYRP